MREELGSAVTYDVEMELTEHEESGSIIEPDHYTVP